MPDGREETGGGVQAPPAGATAPEATGEKDYGLDPTGRPLTPYAIQLRSQLERERGRTDQLHDELATYRENGANGARVETPAQVENPNPTSLSDFSDAQLITSKTQQLEAGNHAAVEALQQEQIRRAVAAAVGAAKEEVVTQTQRDGHRDRVLADTFNQFLPGKSPDQFQGDPLYQAAEQEFAGLKRVYKDQVDQIPELQELAFHRASQANHQGIISERDQLQAENAQLRSQIQALAEGRRSGHEASEEVTQGLQAGGARGGISALASRLRANATR